MPSCQGPSQPWTRQIWAVIRAGFLVGAFTAIAQGAIFDTYLSVLPCGSNTFVGTVESIRGLTALVAAVPLGWASDRWPKPRVLQWNAALAVVSAVPFAVGIGLNSVPLVILGSVGISLHNQCFASGIPALLADLTAPGPARTTVLSTLASVRALGMASGPLVQFLLVTVLGARTWTPGELHWIICGGLFLLVPYVATLRPLWSRGHAAEALTAGLTEGADRSAPAELKQAPLPSRVADEEEAPRPSPSAAVAAEEAVQPPAQPVASAAEEEVQRPAPTQARRWAVAVLVELAAIVQFLGGGMTFKFFPLFFKKDFGFSPSQVCLFAFGLWLMAAGGNQVTPQLAKRLGRMPVVLFSNCVAAALLFWVSSGLSACASLLLVLLRASFSQSTQPVMMALVLDMVPPQHRGKWSAVVSLRRTSFAVSAFIGGQLSDRHDYRYAFSITAAMTLVSCLVLLPVAFVRT